MLGGDGIIYQAKITTTEAKLNEFSRSFFRYLRKTNKTISSTIYLTAINDSKFCAKSFEF
jgi:hypothetical protein